MGYKNRDRATVCNRVVDAGFPNPRKVAKQAEVSLKKAADVLLKLKEVTETQILGGKAKFTGNTRTYKNGTVGFEIECATCHFKYWETGMPYAQCIDCRH